MILNADYTAELLVADDGNTVSGQAVPWDVYGRTSAGPVAFAPGSLPAGPVDVPYCLDHDTTRPIGVVQAAEARDDALYFTAALDDTTEAATARTQMRSRSRRGVSVGVDVTAYEDTPDGMRVLAADWLELSSVVIPAFPTAQVAAAAKKSKPDPPQEEEPVSEPTQVEEVVPEHAPSPNVSVAPTIRRFAADLARSVRGSGASSHDLTRLLAQAEQAAVRAALTDVTTVEAPGQGTWMSEIDNRVLFGMPSVNALTTVTVDRWPPKQRQIKTFPDAAPYEQTAEKAEIPSGPVEYEWVDIVGKTKAFGNKVSVQAIEDNGEQLLDELFTDYAEALANQINTDALTAIAGAAQAGGTGATVFDDLSAIGAAIGQVIAHGGMSPVVLASGDVFGSYWASTAGGGPAVTRLAGLDKTVPIIPDPMVTAGTCYVVDSRAFKTYLNGPTRMRAVNVPQLGVDIALYRRVAFRVVDAQRIYKISKA